MSAKSIRLRISRWWLPLVLIFVGLALTVAALQSRGIRTGQMTDYSGEMADQLINKIMIEGQTIDPKKGGHTIGDSVRNIFRKWKSPEVLRIGSDRQLFVDRFLVESMRGSELVLHHPVPSNVVFEFDLPWEGQDSGYVTVFEDEGLFRMYYQTRGKWLEHNDFAAYAESTDGIHWQKPSLGLFNFGGSKNNNIIWAAARIDDWAELDNFAPFRDTNPNAADQERYKALAGVPPRALASPDGIHWHKMQDDPVMSGEGFDTVNTSHWDADRQEYVSYTRAWRAKPRRGLRSIVRSTSPDFIHWSPRQLIDLDEQPLDHLYTNGIIRYFRAPQILLAIASRYADKRNNKNGIADAVLLTSRDGQTFERPFRDAFILPGPDPDNWNTLSIVPAWGVLQTSPTEISLYYTEHFRSSTNRLRRATLRTDGFVSIHAPWDGGELITKPIVFSGSYLSINAATSAVGSIRVEIQDINGNPLDGFTLADGKGFYGDEVDHRFVWGKTYERGVPCTRLDCRSDLSKFRGTPIRLRFVLREADLYSFVFEDE